MKIKTFEFGFFRNKEAIDNDINEFIKDKKVINLIITVLPEVHYRKDEFSKPYIQYTVVYEG